MVQIRGMTIYYVMYIDPFLKRCIDKNSILISLFYKQTLKKYKTNHPINNLLYNNQDHFIAISPESSSYIIYSLGKGKVLGKKKF